MSSGSHPALSTTQPHSNVMLTPLARATGSSGVRTMQHRANTLADYTSLVPLVESATVEEIGVVDAGGVYTGAIATSGDCGESPGTALTSYVSELLPGFRGAFTAGGRGGLGYSQIKKGSSSYANLLTAVQAAHNLRIPYGYGRHVVPAILIQHGETDSANANYAANLAELLTDLTTDIQAINGQAELPVLLLAQVSSQVNKTSALQMLLASQQDPRILIVSPTYQLAAVTEHRTNIGQRHLGSYAGRALYRHLIGADQKALRPMSAVRAGAVITVTFDVPVAPIALDSVLVASQTNRGVSYTDDETSAAVSSVAVGSPTTLTVTLDGTPTGANKKIRFGIGVTSINIRDSDPELGVADEPLYNWCLHAELAVN